MEKWSGKIAVVTGASAGIGAAIVRDLAKIGMIVIGLARRPEKIEEIAKELGKVSGQIHGYKCDVSDVQSIKDAFKWIEGKFGFIHVLINNAGVIRNIKILTEEDVTDKINEVINTNFSGLVHVTREAFQLMKKSNDYGMIVNINSNAGHKVPFPLSVNMSHNVYHGTKFAVTATSEVLRQELICQDNDKIRVTSLSPGVTDTEIFEAGGFGKSTPGTYGAMPSIRSEDIASALLYVLSTPYDVNITELTIKSQRQKF